MGKPVTSAWGRKLVKCRRTAAAGVITTLLLLALALLIGGE